MTLYKYGFDLTYFDIEGWNASGITFSGQIDGAWAWKAPGCVLVTAYNPLTGEYCRPHAHDMEKEMGYASFMGVEGEKADVMRLVRLIKKHAVYIKGFEAGERGYI